MQKNVITIASFLGMLLILTACAAPKKAKPGDTTSAVSLNIAYEKYTLANGLDVILHRDDSDPVVAVAVLFNVGSNREVPGRTGFAHFFEHMLFQNSENVGKGQFFKVINDLGGEFNGGTSNDFTVYYEVIPKDALEQILWMESDRMGFLINTVTAPVLENEKEVVKNEKRQRVDNVPYGHTSYVVDKTLYPADHPYHWQVIGSLEDLQAATIDDVKEFYEKWYGPNNATIVIAGDIDLVQTKAWVQRYFEEIPAKPTPAPLTPRPGQLSSSIRLMHEDNFAQAPELRLVWPSVEDNHPDAYALQYLGQLLFAGKRAPLYKELVESRAVAASPRAFNNSRQISGEFNIVVRANAGVDLDQAYEGVMAALARFEADGIDDKDMERIKNAQETGLYNGLSSVFSKAFQLASANVFSGSPDAIEEDIKKTLAVTKEDVMRVYARYVKNRPFIATSFVPKGKPELALTGSEKASVVEEPVVQGAEAPPAVEVDVDFVRTPSIIDRSVSPPLGEKPTVKVPEIWSSFADNRLQFLGIENYELPLVSFSLRIRGGMLQEDADKIGTSNLLSELMMEGTQTKTPEELQDAIGQLGASVSMTANAEYITLSGNCLARNFDAAIALVTEILLEPRWDEKEFERIKNSNINRIRQQAGQPNAISGLVFNKLLYGHNNILSNSPLGTLESVERITLNDLKSYYEKNFSAGLSTFHVVGAITPGAVKQATASLVNRWPNKEVPLGAVSEARMYPRPMVFFVDIPGAKQSVIRLGAPTVSGSNPDYLALSVVNDRLGGGSSGILFNRLREERGYTYGANSAVPRRVSQSFFTAFSSVRTNVTKEALELFREIMSEYQQTYTQEDLDRSRNAQLRSNALAFETPSNKMNLLLTMSTFVLPKDYIAREQQALMTMTLNQARQTIGEYLNPDRMFYLIVGDAATQLSRVRELGIGDVIMLDREGNVINE